MNKSIILLLIIFSQFYFCQNQKIPIFAFHGIPASHATPRQFQTMKNAGIDICYSLFNNDEEAFKALDAAQKVGAKVVIRVPSLFNQTEMTINKFKNHPALFGYLLVDEPSPSDFIDLQKIVTKITKLDPNHEIYINIYPNYAPSTVLNKLKYKDYVDLYLKTVNVNIISFDNYPLVNNKIRSDWYENLEIIRDASQKFGKPFWAFACSTIHYNYLQPTLQGIRLQQYSNLLYGAKGLEYFTYWTLSYEDNWKKEKYGYSIVDDNGIPTTTYQIVKTVNSEIQKFAWVFLNSKVDSIFHTGNTIPSGTKRLNFLPKKFKKFSVNENALISFLSNYNRNFVIVQNKNFSKNITLEYQVEKNVNIVSKKTGKIIPTSSNNNFRKIAPGDIIIFTYK